jgi:DNA-binding GntR family transcriptional regulator
MAPEPLATERTYQSLRRGIIAGEYRPGSSFNLQRLSDEFGTSITPIRDAIHRMVGERLLGVLPGGGFHLPIPTAGELRDLYAWHDQLIRLALQANLSGDTFSGLPEKLPEHDGDNQIAAVASMLFGMVAAACGNGEIANAVANASDRLSLVRLREPLLLTAMAEELDRLISLARSGQGVALRMAVREYHRRRLRRVERIALMMRG